MALRKRHKEAEVSTDSLNDIMFFLLLFFLILSTMVSPNAIRVNLPSSKNQPAPEKKQPIHLAVTKDRKYFVDSKEVNFGELETILSAQIKNKPDAVIVLHIDKDLIYQDFIDVMQIGDRLKCKMVCATKPSNSK
jgi:biopolymer transport protein ExbD